MGNKPSVWTEDILQEVKVRREAGESLRSIAKSFGKGETSLSRAYNNRFGANTILRKGRKMDLNAIIALKSKGMTYKEIAEVLDTTEQVIKNTVYRASLNTQTSRGKSYVQQKREEKERREKTMSRINELSEQYANSSLAPKNAFKEGNEGRATAINMHLAQCISLGAMVDQNDINSLYAAFENYIKLCAESDCPITLMTACLALGINKATINRWQRGGDRRSPEYKTFADSVMFTIQAGIETCMATGLINPVVGIWWEKAHFKEIEADKQSAGADEQIDERRRSAQEIADEYEGVELPE